MNLTKRSTLLAVFAAGLTGLALQAADVDEIYRPLEAPGQVLWTAGLDVLHPWNREEFTAIGMANYASWTSYRPNTDLQVGITDSLRLDVSGDFMDNSWRLGSRNKDWSGNMDLHYQATDGIGFDFTYNYAGAVQSSKDWEAWDPSYYLRSQGTGNGETAAVSMSWLTKPRAAYKLLVPDLNGLIGPVLDPSQSLLETSLEAHREWGESLEIATAGSSTSVYQARYDSDNRWTLWAHWRLGLPEAWELQITGSEAWPYEQTSKNERTFPPPVESASYAYRTPNLTTAGAEVDHRWGQWLQVGLGGALWRDQGYPDQQKALTLSAVAVSRPSRTGEPLGSNLDGLLVPLLDPGQVRWDGRLAARWYDTSQAWWTLDNTVTVGIAPALQLAGLVNLSPDFTPGLGPRGDVWSHFQTGVAALYRPIKSVEIRLSYLYGYDRSDSYHVTDTSALHTFRLSASWLW